jgi:hypothetical protein
MRAEPPIYTARVVSVVGYFTAPEWTICACGTAAYREHTSR